MIQLPVKSFLAAAGDDFFRALLCFSLFKKNFSVYQLLAHLPFQVLYY